MQIAIIIIIIITKCLPKTNQKKIKCTWKWEWDASSFCQVLFILNFTTSLVSFSLWVAVLFPKFYFCIHHISSCALQLVSRHRGSTTTMKTTTIIMWSSCLLVESASSDTENNRKRKSEQRSEATRIRKHKEKKEHINYVHITRTKQELRENLRKCSHETGAHIALLWFYYDYNEDAQPKLHHNKKNHQEKFSLFLCVCEYYNIYFEGKLKQENDRTSRWVEHMLRVWVRR